MTSSKKKLVIWGASGHSLVVADIIRLCDEYEIVGYLDDVDPTRWGAEFGGAVVLGGRESLEELLSSGVRYVLLGFGNCKARLQLSELVRAKGFELAKAIHPTAIVASDGSVGAGTVVVAGAVINPGSTIGENAIINTCASIDHECTVSDGVHISPGAHLAGQVTVGRGTWIGIGATVIDHINIGSESMIGAGAVVTKDMPSNVLAYGNPARIIRSLEGEN